MIGLLVQIVIAALILGVLYWIIGLFPLPEPFGRILRVVIALVAVIWIIYLLLGLAGSAPDVRLPPLAMPALSDRRRERFAQELAEGRSQFEAHGIAGFKAHRGNASLLAQDKSIVERVAELQAQRLEMARKATEKATERLSVTVESLLAQANEARLLAMSIANPAAAVAAIKEMGVLAGVRVERQERKNTSNADDLTDDELRAIVAEAAEKLVKRLDARQSLTEFCKAAGFEPAPHHELLIRDLEALERGDIETLVVEMPPGSAKSTYVNFLFPAWFMGRNPTENVLTASHSSELAERWGRKTRNLMTAKRHVLGVALSTDSQAAHRWATANGGEYYAVGVGVGIAGFRADLGIIDDPFGSREDAESKRIRDSRWAWYTDDFSTRLKPGARRVIMHTRWHDDDLAGRVMRQLSDLDRSFIELKIPAQAEEHDPLGREPGEFLWDDPTGYNYGAFLRSRKEESDARTWASLYQQNPVPDEGDYFRIEHLLPVQTIPPRAEMRVFGGSDYAVTSDGGDYTAHAVLGLDYEGNPFLLDLWRRQASSDVWVDAWCDLVLKWRPLGWAEEQGQIRSGVGPFLERRARERRAHVAREQFPTRGDKAVRAQSFRALIANRGLRIPVHAPWRADVEAEMLRFPFGVHDDIVDALGLIGQLLDRMNAPKRPVVEKIKQTGYRPQTSRPSAPSIKVL